MVIVGAGYIACEQACIFNNFGTEVHMLYMEEVALNGKLYAGNTLCMGITTVPGKLCRRR